MVSVGPFLALTIIKNSNKLVSWTDRNHANLRRQSFLSDKY